MGVGRQIHRHAGDRRREVRPVIEIESAQIVLVGFPFTAVLRDDHARHGFEHFTASHDRARVELPRRDRPLARGLRYSDQIFGWRLRIREVGEGTLGGDGHVRAQHEAQHDIHRRCGARRADLDHSPHRSKVHEREIQLAGTGRQVEPIGAGAVGHRFLCGQSSTVDFDDDAGQHTTRLVANRAGHPLRVRGGYRQ